MTHTSFTAMVRSMRRAQSRGCLYAYSRAAKAVDAALKSLPDDRPGIHVGCWYGDGGNSLPQPAAYIGLPPTKDSEAVEAVLEVFQGSLEEIASGDDVLHEFILKWERYALDYYLPFDVSEDFEIVDNRWQLVEEA